MRATHQEIFSERASLSSPPLRGFSKKLSNYLPNGCYGPRRRLRWLPLLATHLAVVLGIGYLRRQGIDSGFRHESDP